MDYVDYEQNLPSSRAGTFQWFDSRDFNEICDILVCNKGEIKSSILGAIKMCDLLQYYILQF